MQNFWRAIRGALRHRWTLVGIFVSSLMVAVFWGANIGALFPVIKIAVMGKPLQAWIADEIKSSKENIQAFEDSIARMDRQIQQANPENRGKLQRELSIQTYDLRAERRALKTSLWLQPRLEHLPHDPFQTIVLIAVALLCGTIAKGFFIFCNLMLVARLVQHVQFDLRREFFHHALRMDQRVFGDERTSGLLSRFHADIGHVTAGIRALFGSALREPLKMAACLAGACWISWRLLLFSLILTPLTAFLIRNLAGSIKRANRRSLEHITHLFGILTEAFNGIETVHAFTLESSQRSKFYRVAKECMQKGMRIAFYNALTKPTTEFLGVCVICLALVSGAYLTLKQETHIFHIRMVDRPIDMESLLVFFGLLVGATEPARKLSDVFNYIQGGVAASERLFPLLDQRPTITSPENAVPVPHPHRQIVFDSVHFHYVADQPVVTDVNLTIEGGETVAIVGPNGCGKTTLANLLPRFFDPVQGSVRIDDVDLRTVHLKDLRGRIGLVTQRSLLFDDTVYNNIRHGRLGASQADVVRAAKQARAHRFILDKLEHGYDTVVGAAGGNLSGGQRQRVALARAMVRDPEILILDEATSQIDLESEQLIHQALEQFARNRTVIIITHRLATLALADRIVVMNHGRIEDVGTHDHLMARCDLYRRLHELQFQRTA